VVGASGTWLAFCVLHLVLSGRWWMWLLPDIVPPPLFVAVPLLLMALAPLARPARRLIALLCTASVVVGLGFVGVNLAGLGGGGTPGPRSVHVVAWNTEYWHQDDNPDGFFGYLKAQQADVYLLQEYINFDQRTNTVTRIDDLDRIRREFPGYHVVARGELITLSRYPIVAQPLVWPDRDTPDENTDAGWQPYFERAKVLRTDLIIDTQVVSFYNVHIPVQFDVSLKPWSGAFYTAMHAKAGNRRQQFAGLAGALSANHAPWLVAGDFNTSQAMDDIDAVAAEGTDVAQAGGPLYPASWPAGGLTMWRVDWAFTHGPMHALRYALRDPDGTSDHRAQDMWLDLGGGR
jgi:endonuclease/exonuclease/phosphatase (EEP) superfamily protein YafD